MPKIVSSENAKAVIIFGAGITVSRPYELTSNISITPQGGEIDLDVAAKAADGFADYAGVVFGNPLTTFSLHITDEMGGKSLAIQAWNALWEFYLLSLAAKSPCMSLYSATEESVPSIGLTTATFVRMSPKDAVRLDKRDAEWARDNHNQFHALCKTPEFSHALVCLGNANLVHDRHASLMLIWSGIEGLLSIDSEISRRLAQYAAQLYLGNPDEKYAFYKEVKAAYGVRSQIVHGTMKRPNDLSEERKMAMKILTTLLRRCVELGKVPSPDEFDRGAIASSI